MTGLLAWLYANVTGNLVASLIWGTPAFFLFLAHHRNLKQEIRNVNSRNHGASHRDTSDPRSNHRAHNGAPIQPDIHGNAEHGIRPHQDTHRKRELGTIGMTTGGFVFAVDITAANYSSKPSGANVALYSTGSSDIVATAAMRTANPDAVLIDQTPVSGVWDATADVDDYERGAVTLAELPVRAKLRMASFKSGTRPGQREPAVYASQSNISAVVNALIAGGVTSGVGLWIADWSWTQAQAITDVLTASGPFPIVGVQYSNAGSFDLDVFSSAWWNNRSGQPTTPVTVPPASITQASWRWCHKCQSLFWGHNMGISVCPAGGTHDDTGSGDYSLADKVA